MIPAWWLCVLTIRDGRKPEWQRAAALERLCEELIFKNPILWVDETPEHKRELGYLAASLWGRAQNQEGRRVPSDKWMPRVIPAPFFQEAQALARAAGLWRAAQENRSTALDVTTGTPAQRCKSHKEFRTIVRYAFRHAVNPAARTEKRERAQMERYGNTAVSLSDVWEEAEAIPLGVPVDDLAIARADRTRRNIDRVTDRLVVRRACGFSVAQISAFEGLTEEVVRARLSRYRRDAKSVRHVWADSVSYDMEAQFYGGRRIGLPAQQARAVPSAHPFEVKKLHRYDRAWRSRTAFLKPRPHTSLIEWRKAA